MSKLIYLGFPRHNDYETLTITDRNGYNEMEMRDWDYTDSFDPDENVFTFVDWNDENLGVVSFDTKEEMVNNIGINYYDITDELSDEEYEKYYNEEDECLTPAGLEYGYKKIIEYINESVPHKDSEEGNVLFFGNEIIAQSENVE